jgi:hypothetical protein
MISDRTLGVLFWLVISLEVLSILWATVVVLKDWQSRRK